MADKGTCTLTEEAYGAFRKIKFAWTSGTGADAGDVTKTTANKYTGRIVGCSQIPATGGDIPSDAYDMTIKDEDGTDVLFGLGADVSHSAASYKSEKDGLGAVVHDTLTLSITNAGDTKKGVTILFVQGWMVAQLD